MEELTVAIKFGGAVLLFWLFVILLRKVGSLYWALHDIFLFWSTAVGSKARVRKLKRPMRIHSYLARTEDLDTVSIEELYTFVKKMVEGPSQEESVVLKSFQALVLSYTHVLVCRERLDGSLRGIMFIGIERKKRDELNYTLIKLGLVMFLPYYRGGPWMYWILLYLSLKELVLHPFTPLYHGGKAYSYKSYMIATQFSEFYPRHDKTTPPFAKGIMDDMAYSVKQPSEYYNEETSVLHREYSHLKEYVAPVTEDELKNPHIKFFVEQNPGWMKGHCLMTLYRVSWKELFRAVFMALRKSKVQSAGPKPLPQSRVFKRGTSYQAPGFSVCAAAVRAKGLDHLEDDYAVNSEDDDVPFMMTAAV